MASDSNVHQLSDYASDQWWVQELMSLNNIGVLTPEQKTALVILSNLLLLVDQHNKKGKPIAGN